MPKQLFKPGKSGNPNGRPKGTKSKSVALRRELELMLTKDLSKDVREILQVAIDLAKKGDRVMIKLLLGKILPEPKTDDGTHEKTSGGINIIVQPMQLPEKEVSTGITIEQEK